MAKPIIGIVGQVVTSKSGDDTICSWEEIRLSVIKNGGVPLLILPTNDFFYNKQEEVPLLTEQEKEDLYSIVDLCDGLIFQGGLEWYEFDTVIYTYALEKDVPMLGICAGMQMMACVDKYNTFNDLTIPNETFINHQEKTKRYVHEIRVEENTLLHDIVKSRNLHVNSRHSCHIDDIKNFIISAYEPDGIIEAIEYPYKKFVLGVQWHPESMLKYDKQANKIFEYFLKICQKK